MKDRLLEELIEIKRHENGVSYMRAIVWGCGRTAISFLEQIHFFSEFEIIAFTDSDPMLWGKVFWNNICVINPKEIQYISYDKIIICSVYIEDIQKRLIEELNVDECSFVSFQRLQETITEKLIYKYKGTQDPEIRRIVQHYEDNGFNVYGDYNGKTGEKCLVMRDTGDMPYIIFEDKRMYFPKSYPFRRVGSDEYVVDILHEQKEGSPHLYIRNNNDIREGSVIVDAGVCEGNFALRYINRAKKVYLIESDPEWVEALELTFKDYMDKVVICDKFLTRYDSENTITLDTLVKEEIDFLKMDIEGAEIDALLGGKHLLQNSRAKCAICSYHKQNDEDNIKFILNACGYQTSTSEGYMFFPYDVNIKDTMDFRKGVVYGEKKR